MPVGVTVHQTTCSRPSVSLPLSNKQRPHDHLRGVGYNEKPERFIFTRPGTKLAFQTDMTTYTSRFSVKRVTQRFVGVDVCPFTLFSHVMAFNQ